MFDMALLLKRSDSSDPVVYYRVYGAGPLTVESVVYLGVVFGNTKTATLQTSSKEAAARAEAWLRKAGYRDGDCDDYDGVTIELVEEVTGPEVRNHDQFLAVNRHLFSADVLEAEEQLSLAFY